MMQVSPEDFNKPVRYVTQDEFNGLTPIYSRLYQELIIKMTVTISSNTFIADPTHYYNLEYDQSKLHVETTSVVNIGSNITIDILLYCTSLSLGSPKLVFNCTQNGMSLKKEFTINIVDSLVQ